MGYSILRSFEISGLFGQAGSIIISFEDNISIIVGENGAGKTTILSALYYALTCDFDRLVTIDFSTIALTFANDNVIMIDGDRLRSADQTRPGIIAELKRLLRPRDYRELMLLGQNGSSSRVRNARNLILHRTPGYPDYLRDRISRLLDLLPSNVDTNVFDVFETLRQQISNEISRDQILYFPTYRRIEEDLRKLGYDDLELDSSDDRLIQFGMSDVDGRFSRITTIIKNLAIEGFSKINGEMLGQFVEGVVVTDEMRASLQQPEALQIVLDRVRDHVTDENKSAINELVRTGSIFAGNHDMLIYFLSSLISVYEQQRIHDNAIKKFAEVCNMYLVGKRVAYDERSVEIAILHSRSGEPVDLSKLSSGEKQIVSLFSRVYLDPTKNLVILFDEPELSLSINWQRKLLPHIVESGKCDLLCAVTHSPFIFDNELDRYAHSLDAYYVEDKHE